MLHVSPLLLLSILLLFLSFKTTLLFLTVDTFGSPGLYEILIFSLMTTTLLHTMTLSLDKCSWTWNIKWVIFGNKTEWFSLQKILYEWKIVQSFKENVCYEIDYKWFFWSIWTNSIFFLSVFWWMLMLHRCMFSLLFCF